MIARASQLFLPTLRDAPADADAVSHKLLVRAGFIRQLSAGLWTFTPLGWRVHRKVEQIIREELDAIGAQEWFAPVLTPAELWEKTGRLRIPEIFRVENTDFILPLTHEETFAFHARELQSYRELPQSWYHFQTKDRNEPRPRAGLIRVREFIMKDSYSFDRDEEGLDRSFLLHKGAYDRIFERCELEVHAVQAESGMMGGSESMDYLAPAATGENTLVTCERGDYAADLEIAQGVPRGAEFPEQLEEPEEVETPNVATIEELAQFLGVDEAATAKAMPVLRGSAGTGELVLALVRGDDRVEFPKLAAALGSDFQPAPEHEILAGFDAHGGSLGPVGFQGEIIADEALRNGQFVAGANRTGWHLRGVEAGRDFQARFADIRETRPGDACPKCGGALRMQTAIEVGHIFKLDTDYSAPLDATFLDEDGTEKPLVMGSYGIGPGRTLAAIVEQHYDEHGIKWPPSVAPYDVHVVALPGLDERAEEVAARLDEGGDAVLLDDREQRAGEKFADADLIGLPVRVTVGKKTLEDDSVDVRERASGDERRVAIADLGSLR
jgi:prolyl-tRNA synthetase